jgi:hypothetical protein
MTLADAIEQTLTSRLAKIARETARDTVIYEANRLEADDSPLCTCTPNSLHAPRTTNGHTCDCPAVRAAAHILNGLDHTLHAGECSRCKP